MADNIKGIKAKFYNLFDADLGSCSSVKVSVWNLQICVSFYGVKRILDLCNWRRKKVDYSI